MLAGDIASRTGLKGVEQICGAEERESLAWMKLTHHSYQNKVRGTATSHVNFNTLLSESESPPLIPKDGLY